ncbi:MAG: hypothetical protein KGQ66_17370 [Acidobacteriota bacterium]|nr:hypothetical protein [Acidobacteriota bacterium]
MNSPTETESRPQPSGLGQTSFEDWYDRPLFEQGEGERLELLATSRRAPARVLGGLLLRLAALRTPSVGGERAAVPWRKRAASALDRWAEMEVAAERRLEQTLLPRRWRP